MTPGGAGATASIPGGEIRSGERSRAQTFGLLAAMYLCHPTREAIEDWRSLLDSDGPESLTELRSALLAIDVSDEAALEELLWEYTRLFIGPYHLPAPPWESVYTSSKRLLMQEAYDAVLENYREAGVAVGDPDVLADHVGAQLNFVAVLLERVDSGTGGSRDLELVDRFLTEHVKNWVPRFTTDLEHAAQKDLYRSLARAARAAIDFSPLR